MSASLSTMFPPDFTWGTATSAYQIEGAAELDGKGPSVWDHFCTVPDKVRNGDTGAVACDHYHRFREDVSLIRTLGIPHYRFSISWPRVMPAGAGAVNQAGLDFYDSLVDELLDQQITPWVTLFHWDYPQALQERGGWLAAESPQWFADYTRAVVERLSDRVTNWFTINEPQVIFRFGHVEGINAPGLQLSLAERLQAAHHLLLAHGRSVQVIRSAAKSAPWIGYAPVGVAAMPASDSPADQEAAVKAMSVTPDNLWSNTWFADPIVRGEYPAPGATAFAGSMPQIAEGDLEVISTPIDFVGLNIYTGDYVRASDSDAGFEVLTPPPGTPRTAFDWPVYEASLYWGPRFHAERYGLPIYITENGMANTDWVRLDGTVADPQRIDYLKRYLRQLHRAIVDGHDIRGYFQWSLLDNFEWAEGYGKRFGIVHVDLQTQNRTPKESAAWYREVIARNGSPIFS